MANDVYTYISYGDEKEGEDWDLFTAGIAEIEYNQSQPQDASGMNKLMASLFPEHKGNYYDWDYDVTGDVLDTKWCNIHNVDEGSIEFHSAWNAPTKLIKRILDTFGRYNFHLRIEDNDWGVIGDAQTTTMHIDGLHYEKCSKWSTTPFVNGWEVKCLTATYYQKFVAALKGKYKSAKELLEENTFYNDDVIDRYEAVDFIQPKLFSDLDDVVCELSCMGQQGEWKFNKELLLNGLSNTSLKEALA